MTSAVAGHGECRSVLIVDDQCDVRFLVRRILETAPGPMHIAAEASSGEAAIDRWRELRPDVVILDDRLPGLSGRETAERILAEDPDQFIVLLTAITDPALQRAAAEVGIRVCLTKDELKQLPAVVQA